MDRVLRHAAIVGVILLVPILAIAQDKAPSDIPSQSTSITAGTVVFEFLKGSFGAFVGASLAFVSVFYLTLRVEKRKRRSIATVVLLPMDRNKQSLDKVRPVMDRVFPLGLIDETLTYNLFVASADLFKSQTVRHVWTYTESIKNLTQCIEDFKDPKDRDHPNAVDEVKNLMDYASDMASHAIKSLRDEGADCPRVQAP